MSGFEGPLVNNLAPRVLDPTRQQGNYLAKVKWHVEHVTEAMKTLKARRDDNLRQVEAAEAMQMQDFRTDVVRDWIEKVSAMETKVLRIQNRYKNRCVCFGCCGVNCWSNYRIGKAAAKKLPKVEKLFADGVFVTPTTRRQRLPVEEQPNTHMVVGMETNLAEALRYIDGDAGIIGIWGMGGVGKTTLLRNINNSFLPGTTRSSDFHHVIWVVASRKLNVNKLQQDIADKLALTDLRTAADVRNYLKNKNFLLLLDDLWERLDLDRIGIPQPRGSIIDGKLKHKVVITTRFMDVCGKMEAHTRLKVQCLDWDKSWELFRHKVGDDTINAVGPDLAKVVAKECCGLPLALSVIGRAMSIKTEPNDWRSAAAKLSEAQYVEILGDQEGKEMLNLLKSSYDSLPDDTTRNYFLTCSMWPEDHIIDPSRIIECCMGLDLIDEPNSIHETYMKGHSIITRLKETCLLETRPNLRFVYCLRPNSRFVYWVQMHGVIRDLALWIVSDRGKWLVKAGVGLSKLKNMAELLPRVEALERISLMYNSIEQLPYEFPYLPNLKVLMLQGNPIKKIPPNFFHFIPNITFLDLSDTKIWELPEDIGSLGRLQYLNLSSTNIRILPEKMASLKRLKHLLLRDTNRLSVIPSGMISKMHNLQILDMYSSEYMYWEKDGLKLEELNSKIRRSLGITINSILALQKLSMMFVSTRQLDVNSVDSLTSTVITLRPNVISHGFLSMMHSLQELTFTNCQTWTELIVEHDDRGERSSTTKDWSMKILESLFLNRLEGLVDIKISRRVAAGFFPALRQLVIIDCHKLSNASWIVQLPCLEVLIIIDNFTMIELIGEDVPEEEIRVCFPRLVKLHLSLMSLSSICRHVLHFPLLEFINVDNCKMLKRLPIEPEITERKLKEIRGERSWWNGLEWDHGDTKATLAPYFTARTGLGSEY